MSLSASQWPLSQRLPFKCQNVHPCRMAIISLLATFAFQRVPVRCQKKKKARQTSCTSGISSNGPRTCVPQPDANSQQLKQIWRAITRSEIDEADAKYTMKWVRCCHVSAWLMFVLSDSAQCFRAWNQVASLMLWSWKIVHVGCAAWKIEFR